MSLWLLLTGVAGGRLAYLGQYWRQIYAKCQTIPDYLLATVNLSEGGLVLIEPFSVGAVGSLSSAGLVEWGRCCWLTLSSQASLSAWGSAELGAC